MEGTDARTWVLMGDGETAEGSVWEAAQMAAHERLDHLIALVDVNRLGQSGPTMFGADVAAYQRRLTAFGWRTIVIDGHDMRQIVDALRRARRARQAPVALGTEVATREAYGDALVRLGAMHARVVALDGDVKNSTYAERFQRAYPGRFIEAYIPFVSTFACFLTRAADARSSMRSRPKRPDFGILLLSLTVGVQ